VARGGQAAQGLHDLALAHEVLEPARPEPACQGGVRLAPGLLRGRPRVDLEEGRLLLHG